jgi:hypothetical protein
MYPNKYIMVSQVQGPDLGGGQSDNAVITKRRFRFATEKYPDEGKHTMFFFSYSTYSRSREPNTSISSRKPVGKMYTDSKPNPSTSSSRGGNGGEKEHRERCEGKGREGLHLFLDGIQAGGSFPAGERAKAPWR